MKHKKLYIVLNIVLSLALVITIFLGKRKDKQLYATNLNDYKVWLEEYSNSAYANDDSEEAINFYGKLMKGMDVTILVLGDEISLSEGASDYHQTWYSLFKSWIESTYRSHVTLKLLGESNATAYRGNDIFNSAKNTLNFDLVITCFGRNDMKNAIQVADFSQNYNDLIYNFKSTNNNCIVIPILPNDLPDNNEYRTATIQVCTDNNLKYADALEGFIDSGIPVSTLSVKSLPADPGYKIYSNCLSKVISQEVTKRLIMQ